MPVPCPAGGLVINEDLAVYEVTAKGVRHRKRIIPERSWGLWHAEQNWNSLEGGVAAAAGNRAVYA